MRIPKTALAGLCLASLVVTEPATANGRFPAAQHLLANGRTIALRSTFGFVVSDDDGATFRYICEEALGYGDRGFLDPPFVFDTQLRVYVGLDTQLRRVDAMRCDAPAIPAFAQYAVGDLDASEDGATIVAAVTNDSGSSFVARSDDGGEHFAMLGNGIPSFVLTTLEMARSDSRTLYLTGYGADRIARVMVSHDGGATATMVPFPTDRIDDAWIAGIDPTQPDTVYVRARLFPVTTDGGTTRPTALMRSTDGGLRWNEVTRTRGAMLGFAIDATGRSVWVGGAGGDGLLASSDGGSTWSPRAAVSVQCLRWSNGSLFVCGDWLADGFAIARSRDEGRTLDPLLRFDQVAGSFACPAGSVESSACGARWNDIRRQFFSIDGGSPDRDASVTNGDAAVAMDATVSTDAGSHCEPSCSSGCSAGPRIGRAGWLGALFAALVVSRRKRS